MADEVIQGVEQLEVPAEENTPEGTEAAEKLGATEDQKEPESGTGKEQKPRKDGGFQRRIDKLTARAHDLERQLEYYRGRAEAQPRQDSQPRRDSNSKPVLDDFETLDQFQEARDEWVLRQAEARARETLTKEREASTLGREARDWEDRRVEAGVEFDDDDFVGLSQVQGRFLLKQDPVTVRALMDTGELQKIARLDPMDQIARMAELKVQVAARGKQPAANGKISKAPPPPETVRGSAGVGDSFPTSDPSTWSPAMWDKYGSEWAARRNKEVR